MNSPATSPSGNALGGSKLREELTPERSTSRNLDYLADFKQIGWVRLRNAFDPSGMAEAMWQVLAEHGLRPHDPTTWTRLGAQAISQKWLTKFGKSGAFAGVGSDAVAVALDSLLGDGWTEEAGGWGRPLITFPTAGRWEVPVEGWHLDAPPVEPFQTVRMFAYLSDVEQHGGGTLLAEGTHRLAAAYPNQRSRAVRDRLSDEHPSLREIWPADEPRASTSGDGRRSRGPRNPGSYRRDHRPPRGRRTVAPIHVPRGRA